MTEILYRKWRPRTFSEVAGQEHVATTLRNALSATRVAHAYLFAGPRGTGKTSTGRLLGKALNCANRQDGEPCNVCPSCEAFLAGRAMDLIELDAASNRGIDEIRSLRDKVAFAPGAGEYKVYLIDEVHMLTEAAFNALLKTLEEPPPHAVFILATTEAHKLPATIASRCQRFDFRRIPLAAAIARLQTICDGEGISCEPAALELVARAATGSLRDSTNLLDQLATSYGNELTVEHVRTGLGLIGDERAGKLARLALASDLAGGLTLIATVRDDGLDLRQFQRELVDELRDLLMVQSGLEPADATVERLNELSQAVEGVATARILAALQAFGSADLKTDPNSTLPLDIALAECALAGDRSEGQSGSVEDGQSRRRPDEQASKPAQSRTAGQYGSQSFGQEAAGSEPGPKAQAPNGSNLELTQPRTMPPGLQYQTSREAAGAETPPPAEPAPVKVTSEPEEPTLAAAQQHMRSIYERAKATGFQLGALLNGGCDIIEVDESMVVMGFRHAFHATKASEKQNLDALAAIVSDVMGRPLNVRCVLAAEVSPWTQRESANRSPLVRAAQEMGARVVHSSDGREELED